MKITKVYTRTGDQGETSLVGGVRIKKSDIRLEAYGTVDELSAHLGMLVAMLETGEEHDFLIRVQNNLFNVCTHLATDQSQTPLYPSAHLAEGPYPNDRVLSCLEVRQQPPRHISAEPYAVGLNAALQPWQKERKLHRKCSSTLTD